MELEYLPRINELAKKSREVGLTDVEKQEQAELRKRYLADMRKSFEVELENTYIMEKDGTKHKLIKKS